MPKHLVISQVDASLETVWAVVLDKVEHPQRYIEDALDAEILGRDEDNVVRKLMLPGGVTFRERISADPKERTITFTLLDHPVFDGTVQNRLQVGSDGRVELAFELDWRGRPGCADDRDPEDPLALIRSSVMQTKWIAEALENGS